jgi:hypothetical protein
MSWYDEQKEKVFDNRRVLKQYCQDDVSLATSKSDFKARFHEITNNEVFLETLTIASACNKVLRKKILKAETVGLIPAECCSANKRYSEKP